MVGAGSGVWGTGYGVRSTGYGVRGTGYGVRGTRYGVRGTGYEVRGMGYGVRVWGMGYVGYTGQAGRRCWHMDETRGGQRGGRLSSLTDPRQVRLYTEAGWFTSIERYSTTGVGPNRVTLLGSKHAVHVKRIE